MVSVEIPVDPTGSSVIEVTYSKTLQLWGRSDRPTDVTGEAVVLDLGSRGTLFALLKADTDSRSNPESIVLRAINFEGGAFPGASVEDGLNQIRRLSGKRELPLTSLPLLVRFRDLNDPKTVERIDPLDFGKSFGAEAMLVRATLEIVPARTWPLGWYSNTGEPITKGVEKRLPWLTGVKSNIDGTSYTSSRALEPDRFRRFQKRIDALPAK